GSHRRAILQLRRDLHNDRPLEDRALALAEASIGPAEAAELHRWNRRRVAAAAELEQLQRTYEGEVEAARRSLGAVASHEDFLAGIQLSGQGLYQSVLEFIDSARGPGKHPRSKNVRKTESTLVRFVHRTALRTTPFGSFTEIGAQPWRAAPVRLVAEGPRRTRVVRLNRGLLSWMASALRTIEGADRLLWLRLNDTIVRGDPIQAFTRGMEGDTRSYWSERFVSLPQT
ncbi:MAG: lantibiotic dehydratase, partial [Myxococcales bacterium]|nr:lantibiotic dehydratase [Myxococcales bacterium]